MRKMSARNAETGFDTAINRPSAMQKTPFAHTQGIIVNSICGLLRVQKPHIEGQKKAFETPRRHKP